MNGQTKTEYDRNLRNAYKALDALQALLERGFINSEDIAKAMASIREVINQIESIPIRTRVNRQRNIFRAPKLD